MIDTGTIRRMRDQLLARGGVSIAPSRPTSLRDLAPFEQVALERVEPLAELTYLVMIADGHPHENEASAIRGVVRMLTDGLLRGATADALVEQFRRRALAEGHAERLESVTAVLAADRDDAEVGAMLAAAIALADDDVSEAEWALFERVLEGLGISRARAEALLGPRTD